MNLPFRRVIGPIAYLENLGNVQEGIGAFIAGPTPDNIFGATVQDKYRKACDAWSNGPDWVTGLSPQGRAAFSNFCGPYLEGNGSGDPVLGSDPPAFTGGQCVGVTYRVGGTFTGGTLVFCSNGFEQPDPTQQIEDFVTVNAVGPVSSIRTVEIAPGCRGGAGRWGFEIVDANGTRTIELRNGASVTSWKGYSVAAALRRLDGQPDTCGDPPPPPPVIRPNPNPRPDPDFEPGEEPRPDPDGKPIIPMPEICTDLFGCIKIPDLPFPDLSGDGGPEFPPTGPGAPGQPVDTGAGGDEEGEAPEGSVLLGIKVDILTPAPFGRRAQFISDPPYIGAAYVYLGWPGQLELQPEGTYLRSGDFFVAPLSATAWRVRATIGYNLRVTPYYAAIEPLEV